MWSAASWGFYLLKLYIVENFSNKHIINQVHFLYLCTLLHKHHKKAMATNKNAQKRYQVLDRCFRNVDRDYTIEDLLNEVNYELSRSLGTHVSLRQLRYDINEMRSSDMFNAPIVTERMGSKGDRHYYYRYSDPDFSIYKNDLSDQEMDVLRSAIDMLGRYRGMPSTAWLEEVVSNLEYRFGIVPNSENVVSFSQNENLKGLKYLSHVIEATTHHRPLHVLYRPFSGREIDTVIHPYHVKQYNNRWFLFGQIEGKERLTNFPLDRIVTLSDATGIKFIKNEKYDFEHYFDDIVGVTFNDKETKQQIRLRFSEKRFPYVVSKPIHHSQQVEDEQQRIVTIEVIPNRELTQQIFAFGSDVEVLAPEHYRNLFASKIAENFKKYFTMQDNCTDND